MASEFKKKLFWRAVVAEFLAMILFVFISIGSALGYNYPVQGNKTSGAPQDNVKVSLAFGLSIATLAQSVGHISGAHLNPAVTLGLLLSCQISVLRALMYIVAQSVGAIVATAILSGITSSLPGNTLGLNGVSGARAPGGAGRGPQPPGGSRLRKGAMAGPGRQSQAAPSCAWWLGGRPGEGHRAPGAKGPRSPPPTPRLPGETPSGQAAGAAEAPSELGLSCPIPAYWGGGGHKDSDPGSCSSPLPRQRPLGLLWAEAPRLLENKVLAWEIWEGLGGSCACWGGGLHLLWGEVSGTQAEGAEQGGGRPAGLARRAPPGCQAGWRESRRLTQQRGEGRQWAGPSSSLVQAPPRAVECSTRRAQEPQAGTGIPFQGLAPAQGPASWDRARPLRDGPQSKRPFPKSGGARGQLVCLGFFLLPGPKGLWGRELFQSGRHIVGAFRPLSPRPAGKSLPPPKALMSPSPSRGRRGNARSGPPGSPGPGAEAAPAGDSDEETEAGRGEGACPGPSDRGANNGPRPALNSGLPDSGRPRQSQRVRVRSPEPRPLPAAAGDGPGAAGVSVVSRGPGARPCCSGLGGPLCGRPPPPAPSARRGKASQKFIPRARGLVTQQWKNPAEPRAATCPPGPGWPHRLRLPWPRCTLGETSSLGSPSQSHFLSAPRGPRLVLALGLGQSLHPLVLAAPHGRPAPDIRARALWALRGVGPPGGGRRARVSPKPAGAGRPSQDPEAGIFRVGPSQGALAALIYDFILAPRSSELTDRMKVWTSGQAEEYDLDADDLNSRVEMKPK
ncbi:collagen alpha-1(I) chain-like [Sarcophilus harrisii]|uniref:collagen alpha-1(I) chain-like n=1 Tax=Sarcophilus harrisii TaxID=9305 RepID=UPI001301AE39|nr:collagen alpha-1(I) chain-like [Sarcophilus harrisii]